MKKWNSAMKQSGIKISLLTLVMLAGLVGCGNSMDKTASENSYSQSAANLEADDYGISKAEGNYDDEAYVTGDAAAAESEFVDAAGAEGESESMDMADAGATQDAGQVNINANDNKKIIKTYNYNYETEQFDDAYAFLRQQITAYGGYVSSSDVYGTAYRTLTLTARIPAEQSDAFVEQMGSLGSLISMSESAEDITLQYSDTESHIKALKIEQDRLNALLEKADKLENIIELENRLTQVRYELESYESQKRVYDDKVDYSTVNVTLEEVKYTVEQEDDTVLSRIATGLRATFRDIQDDCGNIIVALVVNLPYIIIWIVIIVIIVKFIKKRNRRRKEKKELAKALQNQEVSLVTETVTDSNDQENNTEE